MNYALLNVRILFFVLPIFLPGFFLKGNDKANTVHAITITGVAAKKIGIVIGLINSDSALGSVAQTLQRDLAFSNQFTVSMQTFSKNPSKKDVQNLFKQGDLFALFLRNASDNKDGIEWCIYDTAQSDIVISRVYKKCGSLSRGWAHNIADAVWPVLTQQSGFFSTKIAYCKSCKTKNSYWAQHVIVADYDGSNEQVLVDVPTISVAPTWHQSSSQPLLFYSEHTNKNVRLVSVDMCKKRSIVSCEDGITMTPSFSHDGSKVVYCASHGKGNCQLYYCDKDRKKQLTCNEGNNFSPTFAADGNSFYFCSDYATGGPRIYQYSLVHDTVTPITSSGYCTSPVYCSSNNTLLYTKMVQGIMQIFSYDVEKRKHSQLTHKLGNKSKCCWSPCGNYVTFAVENQGKSRIALLSMLTGDLKYITDAKTSCSYPAWSPRYSEFPTIV